MTTREKLFAIGFTDFIFPKTQRKDSKKRIVFSSKYLNDLILIVLVDGNNHWEIEKIEDNNIIKSTLNKNDEPLNIEDILLFFKNHYYSNSDIATIL